MTKGQKIKKVRTDAGYSQIDLANKIGVSKQTLYKYENDIITNIPSDKIADIAKACNVDPAYIMGWKESSVDDLFTRFPNLRPIEIQKIPMLGSIACGEPVFMSEEWEVYINEGTPIDCDFCLVCKGDSMINARIYDGDLVFIKQNVEIFNGDIYAVSIDDEATLKRVYLDKEAGIVQLVAENPKYRPMVYTMNDFEEVRIIGKAVCTLTQVI